MKRMLLGKSPPETKHQKNSTTNHTPTAYSAWEAPPERLTLADGLPEAALTALIPALVLVHLVVAPYTKVEESFNIQATHDVIVYGTPTANVAESLAATYDHLAFPGPVPRTFVGPVLLAGISQPIVALVGFQNAQLVVRAVLGLFNAACLVVFARALRRAYGRGVAAWYLLLQASQFHIVFYASRTLSNMFAFGLSKPACLPKTWPALC